MSLGCVFMHLDTVYISLHTTNMCQIFVPYSCGYNHEIWYSVQPFVQVADLAAVIDQP